MTGAGAGAEPTSSAKPDRRADLDLLRAFVVAGLVVFHSAVVFASGTSWFVKDARSSAGFTVFLLWGSLWGMPLLFVVSGMGVRHAMATRAAAGFVKERLTRLLVPFVVGLVLLVPPMFYLERLGQPGLRESYWRFWGSFLNVPAIAGGGDRAELCSSTGWPGSPIGTAASCCCPQRSRWRWWRQRSARTSIPAAGNVWRISFHSSTAI